MSFDLLNESAIRFLCKSNCTIIPIQSYILWILTVVGFTVTPFRFVIPCTWEDTFQSYERTLCFPLFYPEDCMQTYPHFCLTVTGCLVNATNPWHVFRSAECSNFSSEIDEWQLSYQRREVNITQQNLQVLYHVLISIFQICQDFSWNGMNMF